MASAANPAPPISVPSAIGGGASPYDFHSLRNFLPVPLVTAWDFASELPASAHETRFPDDPSHFSQHAGSDVHAQDPVMVPFPNPYGGPQASSSAVAEDQPHLDDLYNMFVPGSQLEEIAAVDWSASSDSSGVEQQHPSPLNHTDKIDYHGSFAKEDARPMSSGSSDEMGDNNWTVTLNLNGTRVSVRTQMGSKVGDPYVHASLNSYYSEVYIHAESYRACQTNWKLNPPLVLNYPLSTSRSGYASTRHRWSG